MSTFDIVAFDLEGAGDRTSENPTVQIGAVIKASDGTTLAEFQEIGRCDLDQYEPRCVDEFWSKVDEDSRKRKRFAKAQDAYHMWKHFSDWIVENTKGRKIVFVSDNPGYDVGVANQNLDRYFRGKSLRYINGVYTKTRDSHSAAEALAAARGMGRNEWEEKTLAWYFEKNKGTKIKKSAHTHDALDDANHMANIFLASLAYAGHCAANKGKAPF
jgi:hypothetical protein